MHTLVGVAARSLAGPQREVYALGLGRSAAGLVAASSDGRLALLDPRGLEDGLVASWHTGHLPAAAPQVADSAGWVVCTAGDDGAVALWDLRAAATALTPAARFKAAQVPLLSLACNANTQSVAVGTELHDHTASISVWDLRLTSTAQAQYDEVHSDDITALAFHPTAPALLLSGSTDGLVNIYDTRVASEDEVTLQTFNHDASIHCAGFLTGTELLALSHDERFALYDMAEENPTGNASRHFGDLRRLLGCQYVADVTAKTDGSGAIVGAGAQDRHLFQFFSLARDVKTQSWMLDQDNSVGLPGAHGGEIVRSYCFFDDQQLVFTAGEDGYVRAWRPGD